jgi:phosphatidylglycerophosphatase A
MTESTHPDLRLLFSSPAVFLALGAGAGLSPVAPGTAGSLVAIPLALLLQQIPFAGQIAILIVMCGAGVWFCDRAGQVLGEADHPSIVWDEICGMALVLMFGPPGPAWMLAGFLAFRAFDIIKPWPIHIIDRRFASGAGTMGDDLLAAIYALVVIELAHWLIAAA